MCRRPAVSTMRMSAPRARADVTASNTTAPGSAPRSWETRWAPARTAQTSSWSPAAARNVSAPARLTVCPSPTSRRASFPMVVVFPEPLTPTTMITPRPSSGSDRRESGPKIATISSRRSASASASRDQRARTRSTSSEAAVGPTSAFSRMSWRACHPSSPASLDNRDRTRAPSRSRRSGDGASTAGVETSDSGPPRSLSASFRAAVRRKKMNPRATQTNTTATTISTPGR